MAMKAVRRARVTLGESSHGQRSTCYHRGLPCAFKGLFAHVPWELAFRLNNGKEGNIFDIVLQQA